MEEIKMVQADVELFDPIKAVAEAALEQAKAMVVTNATEAEIANNKRLELGKIEKRMEEVRTEMVKPHNDRVGEINKYIKGVKELVVAGKKFLEGNISRWQTEERIKAEAIAEAERKAAEAQAALVQSDDAQSFDETVEAKEKVALVSKPVKMGKSLAPMSTRPVWKFRVTDKTKLPIDLLIPDEVEIGKRVRAATNPLRALEGLEIWEEETPTGR